MYVCPLLYVCLMLRLPYTIFRTVLIYRRVDPSSGLKKVKPVPSVKEEATARNEKQSETEKEEREREGGEGEGGRGREGGGVFYLLSSLLRAVQNM